MTLEHEIRCTNQECPSRTHTAGEGHGGRGALACRVEDHATHVTIVWKCRRCKQGQRTPLPKLADRPDG